MADTYKINNLGCASCASKMEERINELDEVEEASINFSTSKLYLKAREEAGSDLLDKIDSIISSVESQASLLYDQGPSLETGFTKEKISDLDKDMDKVYGAVKLFLPIILFVGQFFVASSQIKLGMLILAYLIAGSDVVMTALRNITSGEVFDENFLMTVASIGAIMIGEMTEAVAVMVFYSIGEYLQDRAVDKSRESISDLMDIKADHANLVKNGKILEVAPEDLKIGDEIIIKPGEKVPVDGRVIMGSSDLDSSAITGESMPMEISFGDFIVSGAINLSSAIKVKVENTYEDSAVAKILELVEESGAKKAPTEKFITRFSRVYTPIVSFSALALAVIPPIILGDPFAKWIYRAMVFLVASCPCALVVSVPLGFFAGIGRLSREGIIAKGANHLEDMAKVKTIAFDKTGTLTKGNFIVSSVIPAQGVSADELLYLASIAESLSNHPLAMSIKESYGKDFPISENIEDIPGYGIVADYKNKKIYAGNSKLMDKFNIEYIPSQEAGTLVYIGLDGDFKGSIIIKDEIKEEAKEVIEKLHKEGISALMLTGDNENVARELAQSLDLDSYESGLLPQDKVRLIEDYMEGSEGKLAFAGDGINDAPVLISSDVGIAMGQIGSDAAIEAADIVIMEDKLTALPKLTSISKKTMRIVIENIIISLAIKFVVLILGALGYASMWMAVFADTGLALLAILNSIRLLYTGRK